MHALHFTIPFGWHRADLREASIPPTAHRLLLTRGRVGTEAQTTVEHTFAAICVLDALCSPSQQQPYCRLLSVEIPLSNRPGGANRTSGKNTPLVWQSSLRCRAVVSN